MRFTPNKGLHFYAQSANVICHTAGFGETATVVKQRDRSYNDSVFLCLAVDSTAIVAKKVYPLDSWSSERKLVMRLDEWKFEPVGPDVLKELGLIEEDNAKPPRA